MSKNRDGCETHTALNGVPGFNVGKKMNPLNVLISFIFFFITIIEVELYSVAVLSDMDNIWSSEQQESQEKIKKTTSSRIHPKNIVYLFEHILCLCVCVCKGMVCYICIYIFT